MGLHRYSKNISNFWSVFLGNISSRTNLFFLMSDSVCTRYSCCLLLFPSSFFFHLEDVCIFSLLFFIKETYTQVYYDYCKVTYLVCTLSAFFCLIYTFFPSLIGISNNNIGQILCIIYVLNVFLYPFILTVLLNDLQEAFEHELKKFWVGGHSVSM